MKIGIDGPTSGPLATSDSMSRIALEGEALGYDYLSFSDHVVIPADINARYPYTETGEFPRSGRGDWQEQLTAIAFLAGKTTKIRFLTPVMVVPHRPAVLTAKILSTIDVLSGGRLTVACGAGWLKEEFEALGAPPFAERGAVTDEYLQVFRKLWTEDCPSFNGRYVKFDDLWFDPKPTQKPHPPLWIGGESMPALRRAARLGDGWYPIPANPQHPLDTLPRHRAALAKLHGLARDAGRDPATIALGYRTQRHGPSDQPRASDGERKIFAGTNDEIVADIRGLRDLGVSAIDFRMSGATLDETLTNMRRF